jgi:hypothetical protein
LSYRDFTCLSAGYVAAPQLLHVPEFVREQKGKQANVYARYSNAHGVDFIRTKMRILILS